MNKQYNNKNDKAYVSNTNPRYTKKPEQKPEQEQNKIKGDKKQ